jgi:hypothetical protein
LAATFWHPLRHSEPLIGIRHELTDDGLGNVTQTNNMDVSFRIVRYVHATFEALRCSFVSLVLRNVAMKHEESLS